MLPDRDKSQEQLVNELALLRKRHSELAVLEVKRRRTVEALRESEENYQKLFELVPIGMTMLDMKGMILYCNSAVYSNGGYTEGEFNGKHFSKISSVKLKDIPRYIRVFNSIVRGKVPNPFEIMYTRKDGTTGWSELNIRLTKVGGQRRILVMQYDITERKQAEEVLDSLLEKETKSGREWQELFDAVGDMVALISPDCEILKINKAGCEAAGKKPEELVGRKCYEVVHGLDAPIEGCPCVETLKKKKAGSGEFTQGGRQYIATASPVLDKNDELIAFAHTVKDITERKQAEEVLRESEERYRAIVELGDKVGEAIIMVQDTEQGDAIHTFVSNEWSRITGYSREELLGMSFFDLIHPRHRQDSLKRHRRKMSGEIIPGLFQMSIVRKDDTEVPVEITSAYTTYKGQRANVAFVRDITERKQAEEREKQLNRLASVGQLAAGVAHELNNPLTGVIGFSQRLLRKSTDKEASRYLERILNEAQRAARVVENLRTFARPREPKKEHSDINDILSRTLELRAYELRTGNIELAVELAPSLPQVMADFHQLQEVFLNIVLNAEQAISEANGGGKLSIKTEQIKGYIRISFTDDGPGIPAENINKLFDPFFTTRGETGGTGLGLSVCHGIVTEHDGKIYARSKPGKGATFFVELPVVTQKD